MDQHLLGLLEKGSLRREAWEIKTIQEIALRIEAGSGIKKDQLKSTGYPAIRYNAIHSSDLFIHTCRDLVDPDLIPKKKYCEYGDLLITKVSEDLENAGKAVAFLGKKAMIGNAVFAVKHDQNPRYLSYAMSSNFCRQQARSLSMKSTVVYFKNESLKQIKIPLPPRPIQDLIADILDKWTDLHRELARELECRKKQYQYYKELVLISETNKWEHKALGEIVTDIYSGSVITKAQTGTGSYPVIRYSDVHKAGLFIHKCDSGLNLDLIQNHKYCEFGNLLIAKFSEDVEGAGKHTVYLGVNRPIVDMNTCILKHDQNPKYLSYTLSTNFCRQQAQNLSLKSTVVYFKQGPLKQIKVPLPPLEEQERIVSLLDPLYEMCGDAEKGIPALISVIKKQYQYYKEELLKVQENLS